MMTELENELRRVTWLLLQVDKELKSNEKLKQNLRDHFFELASSWLAENQPLRKRTISLSDSTVDGVLVDNPTWRLVEQAEDHVVLEENPDYLKFSYVNPDSQHVFSRIIATVGERFESERFWTEHPDVATQCVEPKVVYTFNDKAAQTLVQDDPSLLAMLQDYTVPGKPQVRLGSPRKATEDDLT